jgi:NarL family two-component system response regulator LiaR
MPRVILADDHPIFLSALELTLIEAGIDVVGCATTGDEVLELVDQEEPDAVLLDLCMPGTDGVTCIRQLSALYPALRIVVVSGTDDQAVINGALAAGAVCFVGKSVQPEELIQALRTVVRARNGGIHYRGELPVTQLRAVRNDRRDTHGLTKRELEILRLAASGSSNQQMAKLLWVTEQTIKFHLSNVYKKLGVPNRTAASAAASKLGLLELDDAAGFGEVVDIAAARGMLG